ncbi:hypothetical protein C8R45DRAFT_1017079 [Mycena sanguinolenta]|nr:hypothetical protein C8R45DRAFT_1017079 [Mycena sanguinolenta]
MTILPRELVDDILDYSARDPRTLKTCSLVSREWVSRCRFHLFEKCALWPSRIAPFCDLLRSSDCTFLPHVRSINNIKHYGQEDYAIYNEIAADLSCLVNVRELGMEFTTHYRPEKLDAFLRTAFPNITHLVLDLSMAPVPAPLANMICLFSALQELDMERTSTLEDIPADAVLPQELRSLSLSEYSAGQMLTWLDAVGHLPKIRSLALPPLRGADIPIVRKALQQIGGELHHLDLTVHGTSPYMTHNGVETLKMIDLSLHPNLGTLRISDDSWADAEAQSLLPWIPKVLMKLAAPTLECLTLELDLSRRAYENLDWAALDEFLSPVRFPRLHSVVVKCEQHDDHDYDPYFYHIDPDEEIDYEHEFVCKALPLLANSVLRMEW